MIGRVTNISCNGWCSPRQERRSDHPNAYRRGGPHASRFFCICRSEPTSAVSDGATTCTYGFFLQALSLFDPPGTAGLRLGRRHHAWCRRWRTGLTDRQRHHLGDRRRMDAEQARLLADWQRKTKCIRAELGPVGNRGRSSRRSLPRSSGDRSEGADGSRWTRWAATTREFPVNLAPSHHWNAAP